MNIIALDTSTKYLCLVVAKDNNILSASCKLLERKLSRLIIPSIEGALKKSGLSLKKIDCFGVGLGPGSFTGLRVGLATIKGFAFASKKPIIGIGSLDAIAASVEPHGLTAVAPFSLGFRRGAEPRTVPLCGTGARVKINHGIICPVVDAKRGLVYAANYRWEGGSLIRKSRYLLIPPSELAGKIKGKVTFLGDGLALYRNNLEKVPMGADFINNEKFWHPLPEGLLYTVCEKIKEKGSLGQDNIRPLYLYPKECQVRVESSLA